MELKYALEKTAQLWCLPENKNTVMDTKLCKSMARLLMVEVNKGSVGIINKPLNKTYDTEPDPKIASE